MEKFRILFILWQIFAQRWLNLNSTHLALIKLKEKGLLPTRYPLSYCVQYPIHSIIASWERSARGPCRNHFFLRGHCHLHPPCQNLPRFQFQIPWPSALCDWAAILSTNSPKLFVTRSPRLPPLLLTPNLHQLHNLGWKLQDFKNVPTWGQHGIQCWGSAHPNHLGRNRESQTPIF